jgi:hypothetical protein
MQCLVLRNAEPSAGSPFLYTRSHNIPNARLGAGLFAALIEPFEPAPGAGAIAAALIDRLRDDLSVLDPRTAVEQLTEAVSAANHELFDYNSRMAGIRRPFYCGLTCLASVDNDLYIAQAPPGQALVRQGESVFAFPSLESWSEATNTTPDWAVPDPLGLHAEFAADVFFTRAEPDDIVAIATTEFARHLTALQHELRRETTPDGWLTLIGALCERQHVSNGTIAIGRVPLNTGGARPARRSGRARRTGSAGYPRYSSHPQPEGRSTGSALDRDSSGFPSGQMAQFQDSLVLPLDPSSTRMQTDTAHVARTETRDSGGPGSPGRGFDMRVEPDNDLSDTAEFVIVPATTVGPSATTSREAGGSREGTATFDDDEYIRLSTGTGRFGTTRPGRPDDAATQIPPADRYHPSPRATQHVRPRPRRADRRAGMMEILAGLVLSLTAAVVGVWQVTKRDKPLHGPIDDGTFGLPRLQRWDENYRPPRMQRLRSALPRFEIGRVVVVVMLLLVLALSATFAWSRFTRSGGFDTQTFEQEFQLVQSRHATAMTTADPATAYAILVEARTRLDALEHTLPVGETDERIATERSAIVDDLSRLANLHALSSVQSIGAVPPAPAGVTPRIVAGGGRIYLLTDALYQVDTSGPSLVRLLAPGDMVGEQQVATLRGIAWRDDRPVAVDHRALYSLDPATGAWSREELGATDDIGFADVVTAEAFERNLYTLAPGSGQILKFEDGQYASGPDDWTAGEGQQELTGATDIAVDGRIYALLKDGRVLEFFRSRLERTLAPTIVPPVDSAVAITSNPTSQYLYLLNSSDGRIIRLARDGSTAEQFRPPEGIPPLVNARDLVVDEVSGVAFVLSDQTIYTVRIPAPVAPPTSP